MSSKAEERAVVESILANSSNIQSEEVTQQVDKARQVIQKDKDRSEFIASIGPNTEVVKRIYNPEAWHFRDKYRAAAKRGEVARTQCPHPLGMLQQYVDTDPAANRSDQDLNLFECGICHTPLWIVDPWGDPISDSQ